MQMKEIRKFGSRTGHHFVRVRPDRGNLNGLSKNKMSKLEFTQNLVNSKRIINLDIFWNRGTL